MKKTSRASKQNLVARRDQTVTTKFYLHIEQQLHTKNQRKWCYFIIPECKIWILVVLQGDGSGF